MDPVCFQEIDEEDNAAEGPGDGVCPGDGGELIDKLHRNGNVGHPEHTPAGKHGKHGDGCLACAPHHTGYAMGERKQEVEKTNGAHMLNTVANGRCRFTEKADQLRRKHIGKYADQLRHDTAAYDAEGNALFHSGMLSCAKVLSHKGGEGLGKAGDRQEGKTLQLGVCAAAGHGSLAKAVDIGLHHHVGNGDDAVLHAGGDTVAEDLQETFLVKADLADTDPVRRVDTDDMQKAQQRADTLRNGSGNGGRADAKAQHSHKEHIQNDIDEGGEDQIIKGVLAVANSMENTYKNVVHDCKERAPEVVTKILDGLGKYLCRRSHPAQDGRRKRNTGNGQHYAGDQAQGDGRMDGFFHSAVLFRTESPGDDHTGAHGNAVKKADHHKDQTAGGADCGKGLVADVIAYTPCVEGII